MRKILIVLIFAAALFSADVAYAANTFSADLTASGSHLDRSTVDAIGLNPDASFSFATWVKFPVDIADGDYYIFRQSSTHNYGVAIYLVYNKTSGLYSLTFKRQRRLTGDDTASASISALTGQWHRIFLTYDGTNMKLYLDGSQVGTGTSSGEGVHYSGTDDDGLNISAGPYGNSLIDEFSVWQEAKDATYISNDHSSPALLTGSETNLLAYYSNETSVTADVTSHAYNLAITGTVVQSTDVPFGAGGGGGGGTSTTMEQYVSSIDGPIASTTGFHIVALLEWIDKNLVRVSIGSAVALVYNFRYIVPFVIIVGVVIGFMGISSLRILKNRFLK